MVYRQIAARTGDAVLVGGGAARARLGVRTLDLDFIEPEQHGRGFYTHARRRAQTIRGVPTARLEDIFYMRLNIPGWREWVGTMCRDMEAIQRREGPRELEKVLRATLGTASRFGRRRVVEKRLLGVRRLCGS